MTPYVHYHDDQGPLDPIDPGDPMDSPPPSARRAPPRDGARGRLHELVRDPRRRLLLIAGGALALLLAVVALWYGDPTNRARRDLARANAHIVDKQREVADARRLLAERIAELRAAQAEAEVRATRYQSAIDRATRPPQLDSAVVGGEVVPD